jgi:hypothetical protein
LRSQSDLLEVVGALDACSGFANLLVGRQQNRNEDANDGNDYMLFIVLLPSLRSKNGSSCNSWTRLAKEQRED